MPKLEQARRGLDVSNIFQIIILWSHLKFKDLWNKGLAFWIAVFVHEIISRLDTI